MKCPGVVRRRYRRTDRDEQHEDFTNATALYREMDMRFWLEQAEADSDA